ncbi:hypothetical protein [Enterococcus sp. AZ163]|uniref:hypothetical protein n=1 Tax=Enterococcus sp. AZ163 TaxID=2774638 RepID=UPI003D2C097F
MEMTTLEQTLSLRALNTELEKIKVNRMNAKADPMPANAAILEIYDQQIAALEQVIDRIKNAKVTG